MQHPPQAVIPASRSGGCGRALCGGDGPRPRHSRAAPPGDAGQRWAVFPAAPRRRVTNRAARPGGGGLLQQDPDSSSWGVGRGGGC